jgi:hypothetical protein
MTAAVLSCPLRRGKKRHSGGKENGNGQAGRAVLRFGAGLSEALDQRTWRSEKRYRWRASLFFAYAIDSSRHST